MESSNLIIRLFQVENDYDMVKEWWKKYGSDMLLKEFLPQTGIIIEVDKIPSACGFLYKTDSKICVFEFFIANPDVTKEVRNKALDALVYTAVEWARLNNFGMIYTSTGIKGFGNRLTDKGFIKADENQTHYFYRG